MSLVELKHSTVEKIISRAFKEPYWTLVFDQIRFENTGEHVWLINDAKRLPDGGNVRTGNLEIPPWLWIHPDPINQRAMLWQAAKELRAELDKLLSTTEGKPNGESNN